VSPIVRQDLKGGTVPGFQGLLYTQGPVFDLNAAGGDLGVQAVLDAAGGLSYVLLFMLVVVLFP
jgi:hypothetical protein